MKSQLPRFMPLYAILYVAAIFLLFHSLSDRLMWSDEAETALLGKNILKFGIPIVDDGKNFITQFAEPLESNGDKVWVWNTWLPYYLTAASFSVFGFTTFAARLPFVIIAFLTIVLVRRAALSLFDNEGTAVLATIFLICSVPFLLHARQCRYYALLAFGTLWLLVGYYQLVFEGKKRGGYKVSFALLTLFYSSFISFFGNFLAIGIHWLVWGRRKNSAFAKGIIPYCSLAIAAMLPWVFYSGMLGKGSQIHIASSPGTLLRYIFRANFHIFPLLLLIIPPLSLLKSRVPRKGWLPSDKTSLLLLLIVCQLLCLSIFPFVYFRYLITLIPLLLILQAHILQSFVKPVPIRCLLACTLAGTNLLGTLSLYPVRGDHRIGSPIYEYSREITSSYEDKLENVVDFLTENAKETESLTLAYPGYSLMFYTNMKIIDARYSRNYGDAVRADWILPENPSSVLHFYNPTINLEKFRISASQFQVYELQVRDTPAGASRPDPDYHVGMSADKFKTFMIYKRIKNVEKTE